MNSLRPGDTIDRYTVEHLLGEGGMASVYGLRHRTLQSTHALKLLKLGDPAIRDRLLAEGQAQASLRHPNIVAVTDVIVVNGQPGLLMERIDGPNLEDWLQENRPDLDDALKLFRGILAGVSRAHRAGLVHRDLKPGNVLLDSADGLVIPKVTDFGLAKILAEDENHSRTRTGLTMGTPQYMAPEQIRNAKDVDPRADIFALGCILYVLVCGRVPFESPDLLELYNRIAAGRYPPPEAVVPGLPTRVSEAIKACLQVDREARPPDCEALRKMLYGDDESISGGVRLSGGGDLRPARRGEQLIPGVTRVVGDPIQPTLAETRSPAAPPPSILQQSPRLPWFALGFAGVSLSIVGVALAVVAGLSWWAEEPMGEVARPPDVPANVAPAEDAPTDPPGPAPRDAATGVSGEGPEEAPSTPTSPPAPTRTSAPKAHSKADPAPPEPAAAAAPEPAPPEPAPPRAAESGRFEVIGTVDTVRLHRGGASWPPGDVPPGVYEARYQFSGKAAQTLSGVVIRADETTVLACDPSFAACVKR